jgi:hypothetical protein
MEFLLPPRLYNDKKELRKVGFEIEFGGLELREAADIVINLFGGHLLEKNYFSLKVSASQFGDFEIESDSRFLSQTRYLAYLKKIGLDSASFKNNVEKALEKLTSTLLPFEISMPPLPINNLEPAEQIRQKLFEHSAKGTRASLFSAFGMQINAEIPDFRPETILAYLRSFFLLYDWLREESEIVLARKITPFINPFPASYIELVLNPDYEPTLEQLMDDYLGENPTRNRPLDLLPLFSHLDPDRVMLHPVEKDMVKPRPTFHYRLPNSEVDDPKWTIAAEWNKWVEIEKLAADPYLESYNAEPLFARSHWAQRTRNWIDAKP